MNEATKQRAGVIYNVVETVILGMSVLLVTWTASAVIDLGRSVTAHATQIMVNNGRLDRLETSGSSGFKAHEKDDDNRIKTINDRLEKLEQAVVELRQTPGKLEAIGVRLDALGAGIGRIEKSLEEHKQANK